MRSLIDGQKGCAGTGLHVFTADVYVDMIPGDAEKRPLEMHRFLVHTEGGQPLRSQAQKQYAPNPPWPSSGLLTCCKPVAEKAI